MVHPQRLDDDQLDTADLAIAGLRFTPNLVHDRPGQRVKVVSNTGYVVGHFVTHAPSFRYGDTIGLHLGQIDQLTFVAPTPTELTGTFIDCRAGSPTFARRTALRFAASHRRKLVIPAGVAHTFENIGGVVTRNDLRLRCSLSNQGWRLEDDLVSMPLETPPDAIAPVEVNALPLPREVALLFYRLQRDVLLGGPPAERRRLGPPGRDGAGVELARNAIFRVGPDSWGIIPSTTSCLMDLWLIAGGDTDAPYTVHAGRDVLLTFLDRTGEAVELDVLDLRGRSEAFGVRTTIPLRCDERYHVRVPAGVAYRLRGSGWFQVRVEAEVFTAGDGTPAPSFEDDSRPVLPDEALVPIVPATQPVPLDAMYDGLERCPDA